MHSWTEWVQSIMLFIPYKSEVLKVSSFKNLWWWCMQYADKVNCKSELFSEGFDWLFVCLVFADADVVHDEV